jgi:hypothetical protein
MDMVMGSGRRVVPIILKIFCCFFEFFLQFLICRVLFFVECFSTLGKAFTECPRKSTRQRSLCRVFFDECKLGKGFTECKMAFVECLRHSAKKVKGNVLDNHFYLFLWLSFQHTTLN